MIGGFSVFNVYDHPDYLTEIIIEYRRASKVDPMRCATATRMWQKLNPEKYKASQRRFWKRKRGMI
jgi:hypothetical protein